MVASGAVPDVDTARRCAHTQSRFVVSRADDVTQGCQDRESVVAVGQPREIDVVGNADSRQDSVPGWQGLVVHVYVDDYESCGAAGDSDPEVGIVAPPLVNAGRVEGSGVESVTPATLDEAAAPVARVAFPPARLAVSRRGLAPRGQRMDRPPFSGTPLRGCEKGRGS